MEKIIREIIVSCYEDILWQESENEYGDEITECLSPILTQEEKFDFLRNILKLSPPIVKEITNKYYADLNIANKAHNNDGPDIFKKVGFLVFWITKLKPVQIIYDKPITENDYKLSEYDMFINEYLAIIISYEMLYCKYKSLLKPFSDKTIKELKYSLRYRINSRHDLSLIFRSYCDHLPDPSSSKT